MVYYHVLNSLGNGVTCISSLVSCRRSLKLYCPCGRCVGKRLRRRLNSCHTTYHDCTECTTIDSSIHATRVSSGLDGCATRFRISQLGVRGLRLDTELGGRQLVVTLTINKLMLLLLLLVACLCVHALSVGHGLRTTHETIRGVDRIGDSFVRRVARRVHAPLGSVINFSALLTRRGLSSIRGHRCIRRIRNGGACLLDLVRGVLGVTSVSSQI